MRISEKPTASRPAAGWKLVGAVAQAVSESAARAGRIRRFIGSFRRGSLRRIIAPLAKPAKPPWRSGGLAEAKRRDQTGHVLRERGLDALLPAGGVRKGERRGVQHQARDP